MRERETKMVVDRSLDLPPMEELLQDRASWATETFTLTAIYFDTDDLRLTRSGVSLRFRSDDGWTVKTPESAGHDRLIRSEHSFGDEVGDPPSRAIELVVPWTRSEPIAAVARIDTRRTRTQVRAADGRLACEIDDDDVYGAAHDARPVRFREIEVETPDDGDLELSKRVIRRLRAAGAGKSDGVPKIARVLGAPAMAPPDLAPPPALDHRSTSTDLVRASINAAVRSLIDHDTMVRDGSDPEGVHRARVATRRLRSDLHTFRPLVDAHWSESLRTELQWLGRQLGRVRDADVLLGNLQARSDGLWDDLRPAARTLTDQLRTARNRDHVALLEAMRSPEYVALLDHLVEAAESPRMRDNHRDELAADSVRRLTRQPWKRLRATVKSLPLAPTNAELHGVRIRAKQARYGYEACAPIIGKHARRTAHRITDLQDLLGDHHDATVAIEWLHAAATTDNVDPEVAFVAGAIATTFAHDQHRAGADWRAAWRRVKHGI